MKLTALCICGTLLALSRLSSTTAGSDEGDLLEDHGFGPCAATLRPEGLCRQGQDESMCPYLFSLPPLTLHLPKQLRELEKIVKDLQKLKDNVDQLRKMCADCTVSQTMSECEREREGEGEHETLNEGTDRHEDEMNWLNERKPEKPKDISQECGTDRVKAEKAMAGDDDTDSEERMILEDKQIKKWEVERERHKEVVTENERETPRKEVIEKDGKTNKEGAKGKDKVGQGKVQTSGGNERIVDMVKKKVAEKETGTGRNKDKAGKRNSKRDPADILENGEEGKSTSNFKNSEKTEESDHYVWRDETKETSQTEEDRGRDGIKMSEGHDEHTNKEREQDGEERKKEMENGIKVERNNEKPKQTESIGRAEKEKTIKEGVVEDGEMGTEIKTEEEKTVQGVRDSDRELASSKPTERTDFVSISPTLYSIFSLAPRHDSMASNEAIAVTSSLPSPPSPPLSSWTSYWVTDVNHGMALGTPSSDAKEEFRSTSRPTTMATINTLGGPRQQITSPASWFTPTTDARPGVQGQVSSTTTTTTTTSPGVDLYTTTFPGVVDRSRWTAKKNISTKTGVKPLPGRGPKPGERQKPAIKPEADQKLKNSNNERKPDQAHLPDKKTKHDQKQKPSNRKPITDQKSKSGKDPKRGQIPKPDQRPLPDHLSTDQNLKNNQRPKHDQESTTDQRQLLIQKPKSHQKPILPVQRPTSYQTVNPTGSYKDPPADQEPESVEISILTQKSKSEKKPVHPFKTDQPDQIQKPHKKLKSEPEKSDKKQNQEPITELMEDSEENPLSTTTTVKDSTPGHKLLPDYALIKPPDQKPKPSQKIPKINQKPKPKPKHQERVTGQKTKPKVKPKPEQAPQTNQRLRKPQPDLNTKSLPDEIPEAEANKTSKSSHRPPARPTVRPGETPIQSPKPIKPAVQSKPSSNTKTDLDLPQISRNPSDAIQTPQTDMTPAPGTQITEDSRPPGDTAFGPSTMKTITLGPKTSNSLESGPFSRLRAPTEGFTTSPNIRIMSDLRPQTASGPPSIPTTTRPNKIIRGILRSVIPSTGPGSRRPSKPSNTNTGFHAKTLHNMEETAPRQSPDSKKMMIPVPTPRVQTTSTLSPDLRSTTPATSGPEPSAAESSTPGARELRVKIKQVAAFFNNSLRPNGRSLDGHPKEQQEDNQGGSRPDGKQPSLSKVNMARDCADHLLKGKTKSGVYLVTPDLRSRSFSVSCDMELDGGGWTLLQRRQDGSVSFNRTWVEYRSGFGELDGGEFWLGNNVIHLLTRERDMVLRVELRDFDGVMEYAEYQQFRVASERLRYRLMVGGYSGTAGDALRFSKSYDHNNRSFTTPDRDHDRYPSGNCGAYYSSGWWFDACMAANLNGRYYAGRYKGVRDGIFWGTWRNISTEYYPTNERQSFKTVRMMTRPKGFGL